MKEGGKSESSIKASECWYFLCFRYSVLLIDTVKIDHEKGICLTEGLKQSKDVLFFINSQSEDEEAKSKAKSKKPPIKPSNG